eukprot:4538354-Amphidinium_carterae.1
MAALRLSSAPTLSLARKQLHHLAGTWKCTNTRQTRDGCAVLLTRVSCSLVAEADDNFSLIQGGCS